MSDERNYNCYNGGMLHTFRIKMDCERCGTQRVTEKTFKCQCEHNKIGWMRQFGCRNCINENHTRAMALFCDHGRYDRDFTRYDDGTKLTFIIENISNE